MRNSYATLSTLAALLLAAATPAPALAQAKIFCCDDDKGRKVCGDFLPKECVKRAYEERDNQGHVIARKDPPLTAEQLAKREAEQARKAEEEKKRVEERRRNLALLSTYASEKDIDLARDRAVSDVQKLVVQAEKLLDEAKKAQAKVDKEKEFYKNKALPPQVKSQIRDAELEVKKQQDAVAARKADIDSTRAKFEDERKKYRELKGIVTPGPETVVPLPAAPEGQAKPATPGAPAAPGTAGAPGTPAAGNANAAAAPAPAAPAAPAANR